MKIVNIILSSQNGGAEQVFVDYLRILQNLGHEVFAIIKHDAPYAQDLEQLNIPFKKIKNNFGYHDVFAVNQIKEALQEFNADATISNSGREMVLVRRAIKKIKNKKIFEVAVNHSYNVKRSIGADVIISVNREIFFKTIDKGQGEDKSFVVSNAIDLSDIKNPLPQNLQAKKVIVVGVIGRFVDPKGFDIAIKMIKILKNFDNKKIILKIAGSGEKEKSLKKLAKELAVEDLVQFVGWVKNREEFFDSIDIFLLPSRIETFGLVVLEAMKFCKPIVASEADGPKEILHHEIDGLLVKLNPSNDIENRFADAIKIIISNSELANKMVNNSHIKLQEKFSFLALTKKLKEIFGEKESSQLS